MRAETDLDDAQWDRIARLLPPAQAGGRPREADLRRVVDAILYVTRGGRPWRLLPDEFPPWPTVYTYYRRWLTDGTWDRITERFAETPTGGRRRFAAGRKPSGRNARPPRETDRLRLRDLCDRLDVDEREVRYALARGFGPPEVRPAPGHGRYRSFDPRQAFWLAIVLRLKAGGVDLAVAAEAVRWAERACEAAARDGIASGFFPLEAAPPAREVRRLEIGDGRLGRLAVGVTRGLYRPHRPAVELWWHPSGPPRRGGRWIRLDTAKAESRAEPVVVIGVDMLRLNRLLGGQARG